MIKWMTFIFLVLMGLHLFYEPGRNTGSEVPGRHYAEVSNDDLFG